VEAGVGDGEVGRAVAVEVGGESRARRRAGRKRRPGREGGVHRSRARGPRGREEEAGNQGGGSGGGVTHYGRHTPTRLQRGRHAFVTALQQPRRVASLRRGRGSALSPRAGTDPWFSRLRGRASRSGTHGPHSGSL